MHVHKKLTKFEGCLELLWCELLLPTQKKASCSTKGYSLNEATEVLKHRRAIAAKCNSDCFAIDVENELRHAPCRKLDRPLLLRTLQHFCSRKYKAHALIGSLETMSSSMYYCNFILSMNLTLPTS